MAIKRLPGKRRIALVGSVPDLDIMSGSRYSDCIPATSNFFPNPRGYDMTKAELVSRIAEEAGITHFIEHMIFKGTETRGPGELAGTIEGVGGQINAYTSYEYTVYHATLSAVHWDMAFEVLAEAVMHSVFDPVELEREIKVVLEEVSMRYDRPNIMLFHEDPYILSR